MSRKKSTTVYSTDPDARCRQCHRRLTECVCGSAKPAAQASGDGIVRLARQTKGRKGAGVTVITGLPLDTGALKQLATRLKQQCGVGGRVDGADIEMQGEQRERLKPLLEAMGFTVKISGG